LRVVGIVGSARLKFAKIKEFYLIVRLHINLVLTIWASL